MDRARHVVANIPEIYRGTADLKKSFAGVTKQGDIWALVNDENGDSYEYRGTDMTDMRRRKLSSDIDVDELMSKRSSQGFTDITSDTVPGATEEEFRGSRRRRRRSGSRPRRRSSGGKKKRRSSGGKKKRGSSGKKKRGSRGRK